MPDLCPSLPSNLRIELLIVMAMIEHKRNSTPPPPPRTTPPAPKQADA